MVMALDETYQVTGDKKYLTWATQALDYVLSGEDREHNGGVFWHETQKGAYATCSSGPAAAACMAIFKETRHSNLLVAAIRIYAWTKAHLQDPSDHLFWDSISPEGKIEHTKWSYNTALMIRAASELFAATRNPMYKKDLTEMMAASTKRWLGSNLKDEGRFAHLLLDSWIYQRKLVPLGNPHQADNDFKTILTPLAWIHGLARSADGFYGKRWDEMPKPDQTTFELIDQSSAARAFFEAAYYFRTRGF
jgi:rhamnogalacturonyl hydrolase YesR